MDGEVHALALGQNGELYAGGKFDNAGNVASKCVIKWDGTQWYPVGPTANQTSPFDPYFDDGF